MSDNGQSTFYEKYFRKSGIFACLLSTLFISFLVVKPNVTNMSSLMSISNSVAIQFQIINMLSVMTGVIMVFIALDILLSYIFERISLSKSILNSDLVNTLSLSLVVFSAIKIFNFVIVSTSNKSYFPSNIFAGNWLMNRLLNFVIASSFSVLSIMLLSIQDIRKKMGE